MSVDYQFELKYCRKISWKNIEVITNLTSNYFNFTSAQKSISYVNLQVATAKYFYWIHTPRYQRISEPEKIPDMIGVLENIKEM